MATGHLLRRLAIISFARNLVATAAPLGPQLGANFYRFFFGGGFPTKIDYRKVGTLILTSLLEDLVPNYYPFRLEAGSYQAAALEARNATWSWGYLPVGGPKLGCPTDLGHHHGYKPASSSDTTSTLLHFAWMLGL